jgi:hypothetical protein
MAREQNETWNLSVDACHSFFVSDGAAEVLVHNTNPGSRGFVAYEIPFLDKSTGKVWVYHGKASKPMKLKPDKFGQVTFDPYDVLKYRYGNGVIKKTLGKKTLTCDVKRVKVLHHCYSSKNNYAPGIFRSNGQKMLEGGAIVRGIESLEWERAVQRGNSLNVNDPIRADNAYRNQMRERGAAYAKMKNGLLPTSNCPP